MRSILHALSAVAFVGAAGAATAADPTPAANCDALRAQIDARIRASGAVGYSLAVVDADARAAGKVVGTCERGTKKIVYGRGDAPGTMPAAAPAVPAAPTRRDEPLLTECKDGSIVRGGDCPRK